MKPINTIIRRPVITEKAVSLRERGTWTFEVDLNANKIEIRAAVEELFGVKVRRVNTLIVRGKTRRFGRSVGRRSNWKKAYVTLAQGESLNLEPQTDAQA